MNQKKRSAFYQDGEDEKIFVLPERVKNSRRSILSIFNWNEDKTRKMFRKKILRYKKMGVPITQSDTPIQMADMIVKEDIKALTQEYEKVRYGQD